MDLFAETKRFLRAYTGLNNPSLTFVTLRAGVPGRPMYNERMLDALPTLAALNRTGSDIYFTINTTDGHGRRFENIISARTVYADYDEGVPIIWALQPSIIVESSPGKAQAYWVLTHDETWLPDDRWHAAERGLVWATGADKNVCDAARVLRLPGFVNHKYTDKPLCKLLYCEPWTFTLGDIETYYPPLAAPARLAAGVAVPDVAEASKRQRYEKWLRAAGTPTPSSSGRLPISRSWLFRKAAMGVRDFDLPAAIVAEVLASLVSALHYDDALGFAHDADRYAHNVRGAALVRASSSSVSMEG